MSTNSHNLESSITANEFLYVPPSRPKGIEASQRRLIFFITGNPGLIGYYYEFLSLLSRSLPEFVIYGASLAGFEVGDNGTGDSKRVLAATETETKAGAPYSLQSQIKITWERLLLLVDALNTNDKTNSATNTTSIPNLQVTLIGHSVGAYMALELIRTHSASYNPLPGNRVSLSFTIPLSLLLTPTITHIASSPSGLILTPLSRIPYLPSIAQGIVKALTSIPLPPASFSALVRTLMRNPPASALETTVGFLRSHGGVKQALHMAADEMREIGVDRWSWEIWGDAAAAETTASRDRGNEDEDGSESKVHGDSFKSTNDWKPSKLVLWFADEDHWVAKKERDELLKVRGGKAGWYRHETVAVEEEEEEILTTMTEQPTQTTISKPISTSLQQEIQRQEPTFILEQKEHLTHAWCFHHSGFAARKVEGWIRAFYH